VFCVFCSLTAYSQTWAVYENDDWDLEFTVISKEQFDRIITAQETTANFVYLSFFDEI
jgi:hypothetical protein